MDNEHYNKSTLAHQYEACTPILRQHFPSEWQYKVACINVWLHCTNFVKIQVHLLR